MRENIYICGFTKKDGSSCRRKVHAEGLKCQVHKNLDEKKDNVRMVLNPERIIMRCDTCIINEECEHSEPNKYCPVELEAYHNIIEIFKTKHADRFEEDAYRLVIDQIIVERILAVRELYKAQVKGQFSHHTYTRNVAALFKNTGDSLRKLGFDNETKKLRVDLSQKNLLKAYARVKKKSGKP